MHLDSLLVSLELKGRTLTATLTEAPDMVGLQPCVVSQCNAELSPEGEKQQTGCFCLFLINCEMLTIVHRFK